MNNATFAGRLGKDAALRVTQSGDPVAAFPLAVDEYAGPGESKTLWIDCSLWGKRAEALAQHLTKGASITVSGKIGLRTYESNGETRAAMTLRVNDLTLQGGKKDRDGEASPQRHEPSAYGRPQSAARNDTPPAAVDFGDDDIPF